jgi:hypothetical protein
VRRRVRRVCGGTGHPERVTERFRGLPSDAEEWWLAGQGPEPVPPSQRLPERAGVLVPRAGLLAQTLPARRDRVLVEDGAVVLHRGGRRRVLVPQGRARRVLWLAPGAVPPSQRWQPSVFGHVLVEAAPPVVLRVDSWLPGDLVGSGADAVRAAGFEGLARDLGLGLDVAGAPGSVALPSWRALRGPRRGLLYPVLCAAGALGGVAALVVLGSLGRYAAALIGASALFLLPALCDVLAVLLVRPRSWRAARTGERVFSTGATAIAVHRTPHGSEVVLADRTGWQSWLPGPDLGGVSSLVVARAPGTSTPWGVLVLDRDEHVLAALPAGRWLPGGNAEELAAAVGSPDGVRVSTAELEPWPADRLQQGGSAGRRATERGAYTAGGLLSMPLLVGIAVAGVVHPSAADAGLPVLLPVVLAVLGAGLAVAARLLQRGRGPARSSGS